MSDRRTKRTSKPKVRTGCVTCKIRRIKCDEGKPECVRCTSTGRRCDGYLPPKTWLFEPRSEKEPSPGPSRYGSPSSTPLDHLEELRVLQFYEDKTAPTLANYCSPQFWKVTVPSAARLHPSVKHITIAIAELHASIEDLTDQTGLSRLRFMQHYSRAVTLITQRPNTLPTEVILICCLLFSACENLQGDSMAGLLHIEGGVKLLREWSSSASRRPSQTTMPQAHPSDLIEREIAPILEHIESQLSTTTRNTGSSQRQSSTLMTSSADVTPIPGTPSKPSIPEKYDTFCTARDQLNDAIQWISRALNWDNSSVFIDPAASTQEATSLLSQWLTAFTQYTPHPGGTHEKEFLRRECLLMRAHHRAVSIMVESLSVSSEMVYDQHVDSFRTLLEECSAAAIPPVAAAVSFHFGFSLGLIPPLFLIATRCRDPVVRKEALAVLRSTHRSEGCWDSCSAALIAEYVVEIEERGLTVIRSAGDITAFSRLRLVGADVDYADQQLVLRVARFPFGGLDSAVEVERISWRTVLGQDRDTVEWPLDKILGVAGYQGLIKPERGICWHTAAMKLGEDMTTITGEVEMAY